MAENIKEFDLAVIGSGPGGYVSAIYAAQRGMKVGVVEAESLGGVCLNWGCIPTKALLKNAEVVGLMSRLDEFGISAENISWDFKKAVERSRKVVERETKGIEFLFKKNKIEHFIGWGSLSGNNSVEVKDKSDKPVTSLRAKRIIIATGSRSKTILGLRVDGEVVHDSTSAMILRKLPASMLIIGAGAVGVEYAYIFAMYGVKVTLIEMLPRILPVEDSEISGILAREFKKIGIRICTDAAVADVSAGKKGVELLLRIKEKDERLTADSILLAVGRAPNTENMGLERSGIGLENGFIKVNRYLETSKPNIFAIGDVIGMPLLAHKAMQEGIIAVDNMLNGEKKSLNRSLLPGCTYCQPQVASIGLTEDKAREAGMDISVGKFPFRANGKAMAVAEETGMVKVITDKKYNELLGIHIIGSEATDLIAEAGVLLSLESTVDEIKDIVHAHPTLAEAVKEAALATTTGAIHI